MTYVFFSCVAKCRKKIKRLRYINIEIKKYIYLLKMSNSKNTIIKAAALFVQKWKGMVSEFIITLWLIPRQP